MAKTSKDADSSPLDVLKSISGAAGVLTAFAFISGWLYWAIYYSAFGLNPLSLDFPIAVISVSPFWVLVRDAYTDPVSSKVLFLGLAACVGLAALFSYTCAHHPRSATLLLICMAILMWTGAGALGIHDARLDSGCNSRLADVTFVLTTEPDPDAPPPPCVASQTSVPCKLVVHIGDVYRYFQTPDCDPNSPDPSGPVGRNLAMGEYSASDIKNVQVRGTGF
jgi:hypothetical protein